MSAFPRVLCALVFLWTSCAAVAQAHAYIVDTQPPMNGSYERPSGAVAISFDEPIDILDANAINVLDARGTRVDRHDAAVDRNDATRVIVHVPRDIAAGIYTVRWRVISADTHVVHGTYRIGVGVPIAANAAQDATSPYDPSGVLASLLRWLSLFGALLATGAVLLRRALFDRLESAYTGLVAIARGAVVVGVLVVIVAAVPSLVVQAAAASGTFGSGIAATLSHSVWGAALVVRVLAATTLLLLAVIAWRNSATLAIGPAIVLLAAFSATTHAMAHTTVAARLIDGAIDLVHLIAASAWIGGVFVLALSLVSPPPRDAPQRRELARSLFAGFTPIAIVSVAAIVASGTYASIVHVGDVANLTGSTYGRVLLAKIAVVALLLALGWRHLRMGQGTAKGVGLATLGYEAVAGVIVILLTAFLIGQMPPTHMAGMSTAMLH
jgi:copper transport protein